MLGMAGPMDRFYEAVAQRFRMRIGVRATAFPDGERVGESWGCVMVSWGGRLANVQQENWETILEKLIRGKNTTMYAWMTIITSETVSSKVPEQRHDSAIQQAHQSDRSSKGPVPQTKDPAIPSKKRGFWRKLLISMHIICSRCNA